ncbi:hypothetical protein [Altibacter sp. HG106]|uniref:hypothetical protein n=1 Tax=Altibacter sp. HG106 TaxID=3023937 RepID=UPI002350082A|nr:hypothetical protein [Altibacter sp. HG106]MDC7995093.1 hypothetical protein [Altibacter sp. HG106]
MKTILLSAFLLLSGWVSAQQGPIEVPEIAIKIPLGNTTTIQGISLTFLEVLEDSRCPEDVTCVWAGRARVLVRVQEGENPSETKELIFGALQGDESRDLTLFSKENLTVMGLQLLPYPKTKSASLAYVLLVKKQL